MTSADQQPPDPDRLEDIEETVPMTTEDFEKTMTAIKNLLKTREHSLHDPGLVDRLCSETIATIRARLRRYYDLLADPVCDGFDADWRARRDALQKTTATVLFADQDAIIP
ncbi:MAG: hypothetical protein H0W02_19690 [Ktedonobacteraceae bacterium]|nr:hypothetical protein [Ktedonobacteraceae bacterium]